MDTNTPAPLDDPSTSFRVTVGAWIAGLEVAHRRHQLDRPDRAREIARQADSLTELVHCSAGAGPISAGAVLVAEAVIDEQLSAIGHPLVVAHPIWSMRLGQVAEAVSHLLGLVDPRDLSLGAAVAP